MEQYICTVCGYIYNPKENNDIEFDKLSDDWKCPICSTGKKDFEKVE